MSIDIHQHLWPKPFVEALRARTEPPRLVGWSLVLFGGDRSEVDPAAHDPEGRVAGNDTEVRVTPDDTDGRAARHDLICLAASAALGVDRLPPEQSAALAEAWLDGVLALGAPFRPWATAGVVEPDLAALADALQRGAIGLEVAADMLSAPGGIDRLAPLLEVLGDRPVLVHPGPTAGLQATRPRWWTPTVPYVNQLHAAWWAWVAEGRGRFPDLPVCFAALAGLGPLHGERHRARGGASQIVDPLTFVETSSYGTQAVDAVLRVLGVDVICHGSDRPYAEPAPLQFDAAALRAIESRNPARLLARSLQEVLI